MRRCGLIGRRGVLLEQGLRTFVEVSPHPVLTVAVEETAEAVLEDPGSVAAFGTLRVARVAWSGS